jgi:hypothetical protein
VATEDQESCEQMETENMEDKHIRAVKRQVRNCGMAALGT